MTHRGSLLAAFVGASLLSPPAFAIEVQRTVEVAAAPDEVWAAIGDFCAIADWHPVIATCQIEEQAGVTFRILTTEDQATLREQLLSMDDDARFYAYSILESPLPVSGYRSTLSVAEAEAAERATVVWRSEFVPEGMSEQEAAGIIAGIYDAGLQSLKEAFE